MKGGEELTMEIGGSSLLGLESANQNPVTSMVTIRSPRMTLREIRHESLYSSCSDDEAFNTVPTAEIWRLVDRGHTRYIVLLN